MSMTMLTTLYTKVVTDRRRDPMTINLPGANATVTTGGPTANQSNGACAHSAGGGKSHKSSN